MVALSAYGQTQTFYTHYFQNWELDAGGWTASTTLSTGNRVASGGNPGGYFQVSPVEPASGGAYQSQGLPQLTGNYAAAGINVISFDMKLFSGSVGQAMFRVRYKDATFNGWRFPVAAPTGTWASYSIQFDPTWTDAQATAAGWVSDGSSTVSFAQTMTNVFNPEVRFEPLNGVVGIDNFRRAAEQPPLGWAQHASMFTPRHGLALASVIKGVLHAAGGYNAGTRSENEAYAIRTDAWQQATSMLIAQQPRGANGAVVNGKMYLIGGETGGFCQSTVQVFDPNSLLWSTAAPMPTPRCHLAVVAVNSLI